MQDSLRAALSLRAVVPGCAGCAMAHPDFGRSVNPISTRGDRLCPPNYYWHTRIFRPSDSPDFHGPVCFKRKRCPEFRKKITICLKAWMKSTTWYSVTPLSKRRRDGRFVSNKKENFQRKKCWPGHNQSTGRSLWGPQTSINSKKKSNICSAKNPSTMLEYFCENWRHDVDYAKTITVKSRAVARLG